MRARITIIRESKLDRYNQVNVFGFLLLFVLLSIAAWTIGAAATHAQEVINNINNQDEVGGEDAASKEDTATNANTNGNSENTNQGENVPENRQEILTLPQAREQFLDVYNRTKDRSQELSEEEKQELFIKAKTFTSVLNRELIKTVEDMATNANNMSFVSEEEKQLFFTRMNDMKTRLVQESEVIVAVENYADVRTSVEKLRSIIQEVRFTIKQQKLLSAVGDLRRVRTKTEEILVWLEREIQKNVNDTNTNNSTVAQLQMLKQNLSVQFNNLTYIQSLLEEKIPGITTFGEAIILETYIPFVERHVTEIRNLLAQIPILLKI